MDQRAAPAGSQAGAFASGRPTDAQLARRALTIGRRTALGVLGDPGVTSIRGDAHITPRLRSALYGVLATIDGARALGRVTDPLGRSGEGVAFDAHPEDVGVNYPAFERRIVFAPETSELLMVSWGQRDPSERPVAKAVLKDRDVTWISDARTVYVRTGDVGKTGERP